MMFEGGMRLEPELLDLGRSTMADLLDKYADACLDTAVAALQEDPSEHAHVVRQELVRDEIDRRICLAHADAALFAKGHLENSLDSRRRQIGLRHQADIHRAAGIGYIPEAVEHCRAWPLDSPTSKVGP